VPIGVGQMLRRARREPEARVVGECLSDLDHPRGGINAEKFLGVVKPISEETQQHASAASDVEHSPRRPSDGQGDVNGAFGDIVVHPPSPATLVGWRTVVEGLDVAVKRHGLIVSARQHRSITPLDRDFGVTPNQAQLLGPGRRGQGRGQPLRPSGRPGNPPSERSQMGGVRRPSDPLRSTTRMGPPSPEGERDRIQGTQSPYGLVDRLVARRRGSCL